MGDLFRPALDARRPETFPGILIFSIPLSGEPRKAEYSPGTFLARIHLIVQAAPARAADGIMFHKGCRMPIDFPVSRRALLKTAGSGLATVLAIIPALRTRAEEQVSKPGANYQDRPNGIQRCEICLQFKPPNRCQLVQGDISPKGWCQYFAARENAR